MLIKKQIITNFEQELDNVKDWNVEVIINKIRCSGGVTNEQNEILLKRYIDKKSKIAEIESIIERTILILANDGLIWYVVGQHFGSDEDLYSIAKFGMIKAIDNFRFDRDCSFASFATKVMINEILMYKRKQKKQVESTIGVTSLDASIEDDGYEGRVKYDIIPSEDNFVEEISEQEYCRYIEKFFVYLTPKEQKVMIHTFGLYGNPPLNQSEVSKKVGISQSYVSRLLEKLPQKLRVLMCVKCNEESDEYKQFTRKRYEPLKR